MAQEKSASFMKDSVLFLTHDMHNCSKCVRSKLNMIAVKNLVSKLGNIFAVFSDPV